MSDDLNSKNITELKKIAKELKIPGYTTYKKETKDILAKKILEFNKLSESKKVSPKKVSPKKISPKKVSPKKVSPKKVSPKKVSPALTIKEGLSCDIDTKTCNNSNKYKKNDIIDLARYCGIDFEEKESRKNICDKLVSGKTIKSLKTKPKSLKTKPKSPSPKPKSPVLKKKYFSDDQDIDDEIRNILFNKNYKKCNPLEKKLCDLSESCVIDPDNEKDSFCVPKTKLKNINNYSEIVLNGKNIIGNVKSIEKLKNMMEKNKKDITKSDIHESLREIKNDLLQNIDETDKIVTNIKKCLGLAV